MQNVIKKRLFNQRGVTLIELIAVILILGIIAAVGIPVVFNQIQGAEVAADEANVAIMNDAIERYALMTGAYPTFATTSSATALITLLSTNTSPGPYIRADFPNTSASTNPATAWVLIDSDGTQCATGDHVYGIAITTP
ncbi:MAG: type II secretion system protein [Vulcanibacillus sp.]